MAARTADGSLATPGPGEAGASAGAGLRHAWLWRLASFVLVFGAWEIASRIPVSIAMPSFSATMTALWSMLADGSLPEAYVSTLQPLAIGVAASAVIGIGCGVAMGLWRGAEWIALPVFIILQAAPVAAIIPLLTFLYGIGLASKVGAVMIMATPLIVLNSYKGIRNVSPSLVDMGRSFLASRRQEVVKILLPGASDLIFAGLRLGIGAGFIGVVLAELLITPTGIGDLITYYRSIALYADMYAVIVSIIAFSAVTLTLVQRLEHVVRREARLR